MRSWGFLLDSFEYFQGLLLCLPEPLIRGIVTVEPQLWVAFLLVASVAFHVLLFRVRGARAGETVAEGRDRRRYRWRLVQLMMVAIVVFGVGWSTSRQARPPHYQRTLGDNVGLLANWLNSEFAEHGEERPRVRILYYPSLEGSRYAREFAALFLDYARWSTVEIERYRGKFHDNGVYFRFPADQSLPAGRVAPDFRRRLRNQFNDIRFKDDAPRVTANEWIFWIGPPAPFAPDFPETE